MKQIEFINNVSEIIRQFGNGLILEEETSNRIVLYTARFLKYGDNGCYCDVCEKVFTDGYNKEMNLKVTKEAQLAAHKDQKCK